MAGNIESHAELSKARKPVDITAVFDQTHYGFSKLTVVNETVLTWSFVKGGDGSSGDDLTSIRKAASHSATSSAPTYVYPDRRGGLGHNIDRYRLPLYILASSPAPWQGEMTTAPAQTSGPSPATPVTGAASASHQSVIV
ncbi:hypothetical protein MY11210_001696 [Beauveria gryllotalpidicola]